MISISDILSLFSFFKTEKTIIICSLKQSQRIGEYEFILINHSNKKVNVISVLVNDKVFPDNFSVSEMYNKFPICLNPKQELKYTLFLTRENHYEIPKKCIINYKTRFKKKSIIQVI